MTLIAKQVSYHAAVRVFLLPLDGMLVHRSVTPGVTPSIKSLDIVLYTSVERGTVRVECLA